MKWLPAGVLLLVLLAPPMLFAQQQVERMRVTADGVNLRVAPSIDSGIVRGLPKGTVVSVLARDGAWIKVQASTAVGWLRGSQLVGVVDSTKGSQIDSQPALLMPPGTPKASSGEQPAGRPSRVPHDPSSAPPPRNRDGPSLALVGGMTSSTAGFTQPPAGDVFSSHRGLSIALMLPLQLAGPLALEFDPGFVQKGLSSAGADATLALTTGYVQVPVQLRVTVGGSHGIFLSVGGEIGYELTCRLARSGVAASPCDGDTAFNGHEKLDAGAVGGAGVMLGSLVLGVRYDFGMKDLYTDGGQAGRSRSLFLFGGVTF